MPHEFSAGFRARDTSGLGYWPSWPWSPLARRRTLSVLFVDDLQHDATRVAILQHRLRLKDVVRPLARVDDVAVAKPEPEVKSLAPYHVSLPQNYW